MVKRNKQLGELRMKILYLGLMFDPDGIMQAEKNAKSRIQMATHRFQEMLVRGLTNQEGLNLSILNVFPVGSYPINYKKAYINSSQWGETNMRIGYVNLPVIKQYVQRIMLRKEIKKRLSAEDDNVIILYSLYRPFIDAAFDVKDKNGKVRVYIIQTDAVAGRCGDGKGKYDSKHKTKEADLMLRRCKNADGFILLSKHLTKPMEVGCRPFIIMEGLCDTNQKECLQKYESDNIFLYTGTVNDEYSICEMVDAFCQIPDAELWICGRGDAEEYVIEKAKEYSNIKFWGFKSGDELDKIRDSCDFFINPRKPTGTYTMYSFPSKTMEYLASGKPSVVFKLEGIPDEYDDYLIYLNLDEPMDRQIKRIIGNNYGDFLEIASKGRKFVLEKKNSSRQAKMIIDLIRQGGTLD